MPRSNCKLDCRLALRVTVILCAAVLLSPSVAVACPSCKAALANHGDLVTGFFWSILFMMAMPFVLLGSFAAYMYLEVRRARARQADQAALAASHPAEGARPSHAVGAAMPLAEREAVKV